jgi:putative peptidoglycan lipid II flippase
MGWTLAVKPVGMLTQVLTAKYFGAGSEYDAYVFAVFLVSFLDLLIGQTYNAVIVPLTVRLRQQVSGEALMRFQTAVLLVFILPVVLYMVLLLLQGRRLIMLIAPNMPADTVTATLQMLKLMVLAGIALMASGMARAILHSNRHYGVAGAMPFVCAVLMFASLVVLRPSLGIWSLAVGFVAAHAVQLAIMGVHAVRSGCVGIRRPELPREARSQLLSLGGAFLISQVLLAFGQSMDRFFATGLPVGSISTISYCQTIMTLGTQMFAMSLTVVMFTRMAEYVAARDMSGCSAYMHGNLARQGRVVVPVSLAVCLASAEIVRALFQRGAFDAGDAARTASALAIYALGLPAMVTNGIIGRAFHALGQMRAKIWLNLQYVLTIIGGNLLFIEHLQVSGLALSATLAINLHLALSFWALHRLRTGLDVGGFVRTFGKAYVLAGLVYLAYWGTGYGRWLDGLALRHTTLGAIAVAGCRAGFVLGSYALGYLAWRWWDRRSLRRARADGSVVREKA